MPTVINKMKQYFETHSILFFETYFDSAFLEKMQLKIMELVKR